MPERAELFGQARSGGPTFRTSRLIGVPAKSRVPTMPVRPLLGGRHSQGYLLQGTETRSKVSAGVVLIHVWSPAGGGRSGVLAGIHILNTSGGWLSHV